MLQARNRLIKLLSFKHIATFHKIERMTKRVELQAERIEPNSQRVIPGLEI